MVTEDYVSFDTAKLLKKKGFNEACVVFYDNGYNHTLKFQRCCGPCWLGDNDSVVATNGICVAPTLQMAMKWLRAIHKIDITIDPHDVCGNWIYQFHLCYNREYLFSKDVDTSYEGACEAAIKYCLEHLI